MDVINFIRTNYFIPYLIPQTPYLNYNGTIIGADEKIITADNRGFRYGDGLFETMKIVNGSIPLADLHFERLMLGLRLLEFDKPAYLTPPYFTSQILELARKNNHQNRVRVRLMLFRGEGGLYDPQNHFPNYIIQTWDLTASPELNENGLVIDVYADARITYDNFSHLKSNNYLPYLMAALYAKKKQLDDCILLNSNGNICDASIANIFIIKDKNVITPPLSEGCVAGVMRRHLLDKLPMYGFHTIENPLAITDLLHAEEVFLSNAIYGIKWVQQFRGHHFQHNNTSTIFNSIIREIL